MHRISNAFSYVLIEKSTLSRNTHFAPGSCDKNKSFPTSNLAEIDAANFSICHTNPFFFTIIISRAHQINNTKWQNIQKQNPGKASYHHPLFKTKRISLLFFFSLENTKGKKKLSSIFNISKSASLVAL